jgi:alcohol dehydrogenase (cytochrome c)
MEPRMSLISRLVLVLTLALASCASQQSASSKVAATSHADVAASSQFPDANDLVAAGKDDNDWLLPGKSYSNNRYTGLDQITPQNVHTLTKAWSTELADNGQQESGLLVWNGTMYLATPHDNVLALDSATGALKWQSPYNPAYYLNFTVTRGPSMADGKIFLATLDCRIVAIDATSGKKAFNVNGCPNDKYTSTKNSLFSGENYVYGDEIITGTAGGDLGNVGRVIAFSTHDGHRLWDWSNIPFPGQPGNDTWPGNSWMHGGGDAWAGVSIDPQTKTLFIPVGNPGPDLVDVHRRGFDLYTDSVLALDISGTSPKVKWYYQVLRNDTHDADPDMPPVAR